MVRVSTRVRSWARDHRLHLGPLRPGPRWLLRIGLTIAGAAAAVTVVDSVLGLQLGGPVCPRPTASAAGLVGAGILLTSLAFGLALLVLAGRHATSRFRRTRFVGLLAVPVFLLTTLLVSLTPVGPEPAATVLTVLRVVVVLTIFELVLVTAVLTGARGPAGAGATIAVVIGGLVGFVGYVAETVPTLDACGAAAVVGGGLAVLAFVGLAAVPVLLVWLTAEGLRLSGQVATWAVVRRPERWLLVRLLAAKLLLVAVVAGLVMTDRAPPWLAGALPTRASTWLLSLAVVAVICGLLTFETRLVSASVGDFALVTRGFALLVAATLVALPLIGLLTVLSSLPGRPRMMVAVSVSVLAAIGTGMVNRRPRPSTVALGGVALAAGLGLTLWAVLSSPRATLITQAPTRDTAALGLMLGLFLLIGLGVVVWLLIARPTLRRQVAFLVGLVVWVVLTLAVPQLQVSDLTVDLVLTLAIVLLAVAERLGWQRAVSPYELVLLLVTAGFVVEAPLVLDALPAVAARVLLVLAFVFPAVAAVTIEAPVLNAEPPGRPLRRLTTVGVLCVGYGLLGSLVLLIPRPFEALDGVIDIVNGVAALPFAVILVAVMSAQRQRDQAAAIRRPVGPPGAGHPPVRYP